MDLIIIVTVILLLYLPIVIMPVIMSWVVNSITEKGETMKDYYNENADFKAYVDKYARDYKLSVEEALESALVREAYEYYKEEQETEGKEGV